MRLSMSVRPWCSRLCLRTSAFTRVVPSKPYNALLRKCEAFIRSTECIVTDAISKLFSAMQGRRTFTSYSLAATSWNPLSAAVLTTFFECCCHGGNCLRFPCFACKTCRSSPRPISIGQLNALLHLHLRPINHVVYMGSYPLLVGYLIFGRVSRLDAFSVYLIRT